jgi:NAD(P)-dependent dehydrogenase (short-subunit alcohol dehydrogenase family)
MFSLAGKVALVTGGASGIGLAVVQRYLAAGAQVFAADLRNSEALSATAAEFVALDVSDEQQVCAQFAEVAQRAGGLDVVVNNAGIALEEGALAAADIEAFRRTLAVNLDGVLFGLKYAPAHMQAGGSIINTASLAATVAMPEYTGYAVSKAGVVRLTKQAAVELGPRGIRVNAVCPGTTLTAMEPGDSEESQLCRLLTALGRPGLPEELAAAYHFLAADDASYITGTCMQVDGGWHGGVGYAAQAALLRGQN